MIDYSKLNALPYFMERFQNSVAQYPQLPMFVDEKHPEGITRSAVDECSARVYAYLKQRGIGREDMVMICLPRGAEIPIAAIGVWKAGAACTLAEDDLPAEQQRRRLLHGAEGKLDRQRRKSPRRYGCDE